MLVRRRLDAQQQWFPRACFGMFIHFGIYALLGRGEWVMYNENIPREEYERLARRFDPSRFHPDELVEAARSAGARYMTVTAKHHDGFCMFDSALTDYKVTNTPFGRDLIGELVRACQCRAMPIVLYYSQPDWHHPNFVHRKGAFKDLQYQRPGDCPDWPRYLEYMTGQVEELCTKYGRIGGIWFDGVQPSERAWRGRLLYRMIRRLQPHAVVNDRAGYGDFFTPERTLSAPAAAAGYMVESCQSVAADAWGWKRGARLLSSAALLHSLVRMAAVGGNFLLNVGPRPDGSLPPDWARRLLDIGQWLKTYGRSIYGTEGCPLRNESGDMLYTRSGRRLYLHMLRWPETDAVILRSLRSPPARARLLGANIRLNVECTRDGVVLSGLPPMPPHPAVSVAELAFDDDCMFKPLPRRRPASPVCLESEGTSDLRAANALCSGFGPKGSVLSATELRPAEVKVTRQADTCLSPWWVPSQRASWIIESARAVKCEISVEMACPRMHAGSAFSVRVGGQVLRGRVPATEGLDDWRRVTLGEVVIPAGRTTLTLSPDEVEYMFGRVRRIRMKPVR